MPEQLEIVRIDVCIATFKRPQLLRALLESLERQQLEPEVIMRVIIIDNDADGSARETVAGFRSRDTLPIIYDQEPVQNISLTRNRCLSHVTGDYIAFIDDDERADANWLSELINAMTKYSADAVFGPVLPVLPADAPDWAVKGRFYERPRYKSGTPLELGGTGNVLLVKDAVSAMDKLFDPLFGTSGEDCDFFVRMRRMGKKYIWCDTALVYETVPHDRITLSYWINRCYYGGVTYATTCLRQQTGVGKLVWCCYRLILLAAALVATTLSWPLSRHWGIRMLQKVCSNWGQLSALTKYRNKRYA